MQTRGCRTQQGGETICPPGSFPTSGERVSPSAAARGPPLGSASGPAAGMRAAHGQEDAFGPPGARRSSPPPSQPARRSPRGRGAFSSPRAGCGALQGAAAGRRCGDTDGGPRRAELRAGSARPEGWGPRPRACPRGAASAPPQRGRGGHRTCWRGSRGSPWTPRTFLGIRGQVPKCPLLLRASGAVSRAPRLWASWWTSPGNQSPRPPTCVFHKSCGFQRLSSQ